MKLFTIGFTKKSLEKFVGLLKANRVETVVDVRLRNSGQLLGFAKGRDLEFLLKEFGIGYRHVIALAPNDEILDDYKMTRISWQDYEEKFKQLMERRDGNAVLLKEMVGGKTLCLLCSEEKATQCHRRLVAELVRDNVEIVHL